MKRLSRTAFGGVSSAREQADKSVGLQEHLTASHEWFFCRAEAGVALMSLSEQKAQSEQPPCRKRVQSYYISDPSLSAFFYFRSNFLDNSGFFFFFLFLQDYQLLKQVLNGFRGKHLCIVPYTHRPQRRTMRLHVCP